MKKIYILHENDEWTVHLTKRLDQLKLPFESWHLAKGIVDIESAPPEGIFYNRMSASSHTRGHRYAPELTASVLAWLELHGSTVFNGRLALSLELSKVNQYSALQKAGIRTPKTIAAVGRDQILEAAIKLDKTPFITKHNRAGKGLGVQLFNSIDALSGYIDGPTFEEPVDGITLIQEYIQSSDSSITRVEFIGGQFFYAVRVDTSEGFELCPADACQINEANCPVGETPASNQKFSIIDGFSDPIITQYQSFLQLNGIDIAGIEFIKGRDGSIYTYDINTNTNYNADAETKAGKYGMLQLAHFLGKSLKDA